MKAVIPILCALALGACREDETVGAYGAADRVWTLVELDGAPFDAKATLTFGKDEKIAGTAPCNSYSADMSAPYPWFEAGPLAVTRRACPELEDERRYLSALSEMTLSEVAGNTLILSNDAGREMVFTSGD